MTLIFSASADQKSSQHSFQLFGPFIHWLLPRLSQEHIDLLHHIFRKCCHLSEYAILALLAWRAIRKPDQHVGQPWSWAQAGGAVAIVFAYGASDEFHQIFVPTRTALFSDVLIDTAGGSAGMVILWLTGKLSKRW